jgi:hypothetical protein
MRPQIPLVLLAVLAAALSGCSITGPARPGAPPPPAPESPAGTARPAPAPPVQGAPTPPPAPPSVPPPRQFRLGPAATALVGQARHQEASGDYGQAAETLERALRIEPDNPLVWTELGRVRLGEHNPAQADAMGRKALTLATGDPSAQAGAWRLIAESLRARNRNDEAYEADRRAEGLTPH